MKVPLCRVHISYHTFSLLKEGSKWGLLCLNCTCEMNLHGASRFGSSIFTTCVFLIFPFDFEPLIRLYSRFFLSLGYNFSVNLSCNFCFWNKYRPRCAGFQHKTTRSITLPKREHNGDRYSKSQLECPGKINLDRTFLQLNCVCIFCRFFFRDATIRV